MRHVSLCVAASVALLALGAGCTPSVYVDASNTSGVEDGTAAHPYRVIQSAVDDTTGAVQVQIASGTYPAFSVSGRAQMTFSGPTSGSATIDDSGASPLVTIASSTQMELTRLAIHTTGSAGLQVNTGSGLSLVDMTIQGASSASNGPTLIGVSGGSSVSLQTTTVATGGVGIRADGTSTIVNLMIGSVVQLADHGAIVTGGATFDVSGTAFTQNRVGIFASDTGTTLAMDATSTIEHSAVGWGGLLVGHGASATLDGTSVVDNGGIGVESEDPASPVIVRNAHLDRNDTGALAAYGGSIEIDHCVLDGNNVGVLVQQAVSSALVHGGTTIENSKVYGVASTLAGASIVIDGSTVTGTTGSGVFVDRPTPGASPNLIVQNGSSITASGGKGVDTTRALVEVTNSTVTDNLGDGVSCNGGTCHVGDGTGLGNTITGQSTAGTFGIHCPNSGVADCQAGENSFFGNATDIDPACAATCPM